MPEWPNHVIRAADVVTSLPAETATMVANERAAWELGKAESDERAADVVTSLPAEAATIVANEVAARELAKVEPNQRPGVVQAIVNQDKHSYRLIEAALIGKCHHVVTNEATARVLANVEPAERADLIKNVVEAAKPSSRLTLQVTGPPLSVLERARRYLAKCPPATSGQHGDKATFRVACQIVHGFALGTYEAMSVLREWNQTCVPPWSEEELQRKVKAAAKAAPLHPQGHLVQGTIQPTSGGAAVSEKRESTTSASTPAVARPGKPEYVPEVLNRVAALRPDVDDQFVKDRSPVTPETQTPASFLQRLYKPGDCVVVFDVFRSQGRHICQWVASPYNAACLDHLIHGCPKGVWFLCNPVDGEFHPNPREGGKLSRRSEESVTSWRYMLVESDDAPPRPWLAALVQMPLRIAAIYKSGGKSIHALIQLDATSKADWETKARALKPLLERFHKLCSFKSGC